MKLTIGMSCYDDFHGVWFTIQSIKMYHPEVIDDVKFIVIDGNPGQSHGIEVEKLIAKLTNKHGQNALYVSNETWASTASRDYIFQFAETPYVLCLDSHVMLAPGSIKKLIEHFDNNPTTKDIISGPIYDDNHNILATHMTRKWDYNMLGGWELDMDKIKTDEKYIVDMMGLGVFACTKESWPGFNRNFKGFGGEEGYIHDKIRKNGGEAICFPWLKWLHRFPRPDGAKYNNIYEDRINNYFHGYIELNKQPDDIIDYYSKSNELEGQQRTAISKEKLKLMYEKCKIDQQISSLE